MHMSFTVKLSFKRLCQTKYYRSLSKLTIISVKETMKQFVPNKNQVELDHTANTLKKSGPVSLSEVSRSIVTLNPNYCIVDKPSGVRMDGDFNVTVEKLVLHWEPTIGNVKTLKWVHQLDYATSGALCIALNSSAAALASKAFELRETKKVYLAVLQGHMDTSKYPLLDVIHPFIPEEVTSSGRILNATESKGHDSIWGNETMLANFMVQYEVLQSLKRIHSNRNSDNAGMSPSENSGIASYQMYVDALELIDKTAWAAAVFGRLSDTELSVFRYNAVARQSLKKLIKFCKIPIALTKYVRKTFNKDEVTAVGEKSVPSFHAQSVQTASGITTVDRPTDIAHNSGDAFIVNLIQSALNDVFNYNAQYAAGSAAEGGSKDVPPIYRVAVRDENRLSDFVSENNLDRVFVNIPLAEKEEDFRMEPGHEANPGRAAQTVVQVLERGYYQGRPVTKVRLLPRTGRRHQLRIHCLCLGHPIVGDFTYNALHRRAVEEEAAREQSSTENRGNIEIGGNDADCVEDMVADRMMLHAHTLRIPVPSTDKTVKAADRSAETDDCGISSSGSGSGSKKLKREVAPLVEVETRDPFPFVQGQLTPIMPSYTNCS